MYKQMNLGRVFMGRLEYDDDLLLQLTEFCREHDIRAGIFSVIGAVQNAKLGYYSQKEKKYTGCVQLNKKLEITSCSGNISVNNEGIFVHAHVVLCDYKARTFGGHLMPGTKVFAAEFFIQELTGADLIRVKNRITGLPLWE